MESRIPTHYTKTESKREKVCSRCNRRCLWVKKISCSIVWFGKITSVDEYRYSQRWKCGVNTFRKDRSSDTRKSCDENGTKTTEDIHTLINWFCNWGDNEQKVRWKNGERSWLSFIKVIVIDITSSVEFKSVRWD